MSKKPMHLLSRIEADELYETKRGMGGYAIGDSHPAHIEAQQHLAKNGLVTHRESEWDKGAFDAEVTEAGMGEYHRYHTLPRFEDELIQAISYLETFKAEIDITINDQQKPLAGSISETLIALAKALRDQGVQS